MKFHLYTDTTDLDLKKVLIATICEIEIFGWISNTMASKNFGSTEQSTSWWVKRHMMSREQPEVKDRIKDMLEKAEILGVDMFSFEEEADEAIEWAKNLCPDSNRDDYYTTSYKTNDFEKTIKDLAIRGNIATHEVSWACAIVPSYRRWKENQKNPSNYVGTIGEVISLDVEITEVKNTNSAFLVKGYVKGTGDYVYWWANKDPQLQAKQTIQIEARVKTHDSFAQKNQTRLTRVVIK